MKKSIFKKWWFWAIAIIIIIAIAVNGSGDGDQDKNASSNENDIPASSDNNAEKPAKKPVENSEIKPGSKIEFDNIIVRTQSGITTVEGEAKNNTADPQAFTLKVAFYDKDNKLLGSAVGAVNDIAPGETKVFTAMASEDFSKAASNKVQVDTMIGGSAERIEMIKKIEFSNTVVKTQGGITTVDGEVKNADDSKHTFSLKVNFYDNDKRLLGSAIAAINDLEAGEQKVFTAMASGNFSKASTHTVQIDTLVE